MVVLISKLAPFNDQSYFPVAKWRAEVFSVVFRSKLGHAMVPWGKLSQNCLQKAFKANETTADENRFFFGNKGISPMRRF